MRWTVRPLGNQDEALLATAVLGNIDWSGERVSADDVPTRPEFRRYIELVPARRDFGLVAEVAGEPIGAVWAQYLSAGYGFVDEATPELCLWVESASRGMGVGRGLLRHLQATARRRGIARVSLSVEPANFAAGLYAAEGFAAVAGREADGVMIWASRTLTAPLDDACPPRRPAGSVRNTQEVVQSSMVTLSVSEAREQLADALEQARRETVVIEKYGRPAAILISPERYEELMDAMEEIEDIAAFDEAMAEEGPGIPWDQVKADLGWQ